MSKAKIQYYDTLSDRQFSSNSDRTLHFNCGGDRQFSPNRDRPLRLI
ncbi:MAG: hypothetical protein WBA57_13120 [Elainellaceae cyanobacterium]